MKTTPRDYTFKYNSKNPFDKLHDDEPWFFIRAQDKLSVDAVRHYAHLLKKESEQAFRDGDEARSNELLKQSLGVLRVASTFNDWQSDHKELVKLPD